MYNRIIQNIIFYNNLVEYSLTYGKPYTIKYITNMYSYQQAVQIIQELYRRNWKQNENT